MQYGIREICNVVLKAKAPMRVGNKIFYANEPVIYFDTLKSTSLEGAATTVYAQGGRGNARLMAWEGERTVTFTMEDALISPEGFMILSGAGLVDASNEKPVYQHITETIDISDCKLTASKGLEIKLTQKPYLPNDKQGNFAYVMLVKDGNIVSEPYIPVHEGDESLGEGESAIIENEDGTFSITVFNHEAYDAMSDTEDAEGHIYKADNAFATSDETPKLNTKIFDSVMVDYYVERKGDGTQQIEITPDKFGGNFYLEASTLFRTKDGVDLAAEFIIPNCKIQSNFTFTMASSGDPSTFTFTMDAFPDYLRFDHSKKVLFALQTMQDARSSALHRHETVHEASHDLLSWN